MNPARRAAPRAVWPVSAAVVALALVVVTVAASGGSSALPVTRGIAQALLTLSIAGVLGIGAVAAMGRVEDDEQRGRLLDVAAALAAAWTVLAAGTAFLLYLGEAPAPDSPAFGPGLVSFIADVEIGRTWAVAAVCAAVLTAILVAVSSRRGLVVVWVLTVLAVVPIALQSAMAGESLSAARVLDTAGLVQLVALGTWLGALALGAAGTALPIACAAAAGVATLAALPSLLADGAVDPLSVGGAVVIALAGLLAVAGAVTGRRTGGAQLLLVAAGIGLGIAAAITQVMPGVAARTTPAEILTGSALPPTPTIVGVLGAWLPDPLWLVVAAMLLVGYGVVIRRAGTQPARRSISWVIGVLVLIWLTSGAPAVYAPTVVAAALLQQAGLLLVVPVLLAGGRPGEVAARLVGALPLVVRPRPVLAVLVAVLIALLLVGSDALRWSVSDPLGREVTGVVVLLAGLLLVAALTDAGVRRGTALVVLVVLVVLETAGAAVLALGSGLLLADWFGAMGWGTDALAAQRAAALPVWLVLVLPTLLLLVRTVRRAPMPAPVVAAEAVTV